MPKDYVRGDVTAENFLKILTGQPMRGIGSGKTLQSTEKDNVFIYYADHGATGLVAMPTGKEGAACLFVCLAYGFWWSHLAASHVCPHQATTCMLMSSSQP